MKNFSKNIALASVALLAVSCSNNDSIIDDQPESTKVKLEFTISSEAEPTRAQFVDLTGTSYAVTWEVGDELSAFSCQTGSVHAAETMTVTELKTGKSKNAAYCSGDVTKSTIGYNVAYPTTCSPTTSAAHVIETSIPAQQKATLNNADKSAIVMVAWADPDASLVTMYHVGAYLDFDIVSTDIKSIKLETVKDGYYIAGGISSTVSNSGITSTSAGSLTGSTSVELTNNGSAFEAGEYVIVVRPGNYSDGIKLTLTKTDGSTVTKTTTSLTNVQQAYLYECGQW